MVTDGSSPTACSLEFDILFSWLSSNCSNAIRPVSGRGVLHIPEGIGPGEQHEPELIVTR